jgi:hypothetical protein
MLLGVAILFGCAAETESGVPRGESTDAIRSGWGFDTGARPEVFVLNHGGSYCTATALSPTVVLTASHCIDHTSAEYEGLDGGWVSLMDSWGREDGRLFGVRAARSFGGDGTHDVALVRVDPLPLGWYPDLAPIEPPHGTRIEAYGVGMNGWGAWCYDYDSGVIQKRVVWLEWPPDWNENYICPGDSGGPIFDSQGRIAAVHASSAAFHVGVTGLGHVWELTPELVAQRDAWSW